MLTINPILKLSLIQSIECIRIAVCILSQRYLEAFDSVAVPCSNHDTVGLCSDSCLHYRRYSLKFASHTFSFIHRWPRSISVLSSVQWLLLRVDIRRLDPVSVTIGQDCLLVVELVLFQLAHASNEISVKY